VTHPAIAVAVAVWVAGCASSQATPPSAAVNSPKDSRQNLQTAESEPVIDTGKSQPVAATPQPSDPAPSDPDKGVIRRSELDGYIKEGPQRFIQLVQVRPTFRRGRFFGWRVLGYQGPGPIRPGDIVIRINGRSMERPAQFMSVWNRLPKETELVVSLVRENKPVTLRFPIVD
jgi:type II secretory pathway component PulC